MRVCVLLKRSFCTLHRAKLICSSDSLFFEEVEILKSLFLANNYPSQFFDKIWCKFLGLSSHHTQENENCDECETCFFKVSYTSPASEQFTKSLSELVYREFGLKLRVVYDIFKINRYFQLKTKTPHSICSNVAYQFRCSCDANVAYVGMTTRHLAARACDHLDLAGLQKNVVAYQFRCSCDTNVAYVGMTTRHLAARACDHLDLAGLQKNAIKEHIRACAICHGKKYTVNSFQILKSCHTEYETKIQEALLIKKLNPKLNKHLYAKGVSFLLSIFLSHQIFCYVIIS